MSSHAVLVPSGLEACKAATFVLPITGRSLSCWAVAPTVAPNSAQDRGSHRLTAAGTASVNDTTLAGVHFKPSNLLTAAASGPAHLAGLSDDGTPGTLYEGSWLVVSPATVAEDMAPSPQTLLQLRHCRPASSAAAALMALKTLSGSSAQRGMAGVQPTTKLQGGDEHVRALLRTAQLEQPGLGACLAGTAPALLHLDEHTEAMLAAAGVTQNVSRAVMRTSRISYQ